MARELLVFRASSQQASCCYWERVRYDHFAGKESHRQIDLCVGWGEKRGKRLNFRESLVVLLSGAGCPLECHLGWSLVWIIYFIQRIRHQSGLVGIMQMVITAKYFARMIAQNGLNC